MPFAMNKSKSKKGGFGIIRVVLFDWSSDWYICLTNLPKRLSICRHRYLNEELNASIAPAWLLISLSPPSLSPSPSLSLSLNKSKNKRRPISIRLEKQNFVYTGNYTTNIYIYFCFSEMEKGAFFIRRQIERLALLKSCSIELVS